MHYRRSGMVWIISGSVLGTYSLLGLIGFGVPGIEDLVAFLSQAEGWEFIVAAFIAIMFEGLYLVGNFFPGTSIVMLLAVLSSVGSWWRFVATIVAIFIGWCVAGAINIFLAHRAMQRAEKPAEPFVVRDNVLLTWLPTFRANYEVSQIAAGGNLWQVLFSAIRVRFIASLVAGAIAAVVAVAIDLESIDNEEGFLSLFVFVAIMLYVGWREFQKAKTYSHEHPTRTQLENSARD
jgi:hypothetical protein